MSASLRPPPRPERTWCRRTVFGKYYRLNVVRINLPPLRERGDDIVVLANRFLQRQRDAQGPRRFSETARQALLAYAWPDTARELENVIAQALLRARGPVIRTEDLALHESRLHPTLAAQEAAPVSLWSASLETRL